MRLNASILMDELSGSYPVAYFGPQETQLLVKRPEIYNIYRENVPFSKNRTYCVTPELLPEKPVCEEGTLLVCVGEFLPEMYRQGVCRCIWFRTDPTEIIEVFNIVQRIFDKYDDWEYQLQSILYSTASIQEMLDCTQPLFRNPIIVIDAALRFLGRSRIIDTDPALADYRPGADGKVQLAHLQQYCEFRDIHTKAGPVFYDEQGVEFYIWDVWQNDNYLGNVTVPFFQPRRESDRWLLSVLEHYISNALTRYVNNPELRANVLRTAFHDLLEGKNLSGETLRTLESYAGHYQCVRMKFLHHTEHAQPVSYYCSYVENALPNSVCFVHAGAMVAFVDVTDCADVFSIRETLWPIVRELNLCAGVSNVFTNLAQTSVYYQQAYGVMKIGLPRDTSPGIHMFQDHMLRYLLRSAFGGMPPEALYTPGLSRIAAHDAQSKVSYAQTLRVYLNNAMNITKTALDLQIHRSSFLERLRNIEALLGVSLDDPRQRLYLQIMLEMIDL